MPFLQYLYCIHRTNSVAGLALCAVVFVNKETRRGFFIDKDYCTKCKSCYTVCPVNAVKILKERHIRLEEELKIPPEGIEIIEGRTKMKLRDILQSKHPIIVTIQKNKPVREPVKPMTKKNIR